MVYPCHFENKEYIHIVGFFSDQSVLNETWILKKPCETKLGTRESKLSVEMDGQSLHRPCNQGRQT